MNANQTANRCIACTVEQCAHHCPAEDFCSLDRITVGCHETSPTTNQRTNCMSFSKK